MVLFEYINDFANPNGRYGLNGNARRRRLFIPPSTNRPLFSYGYGDDQRSFLSLIETGSEYTSNSESSDAASVSTSRSLPSTLASVQNDNDGESFRSWLLEHQQQRYSAVNSDEDIGDNHSRHNSLLHGGIYSRRSSKSTFSQKNVDDFDFANLRTNLRIESKILLRFSVPLTITFILEHFFSIICLLVVGHLGKNELAAVSLGTMLSTITFAIFEGIATALDTLCPQAYGSGKYKLVGTHIQRCLVFSWITFIPCAIAWWYAKYLLRYIIESEEVLELTSQFLRVFIIGGPAYIFFEDGKRLLQSQGIFEAGPIILFFSALTNVCMSWAFVWSSKFGMGFIGAPIASVINFYVMDVFLILYIAFVDGKKCWFGVQPLSKIFSHWGHLMHLALPGIVMLESEYLAYEVMTLFASFFGTTELAAQSAISSIASLAYMVPFSIGIACSTRIANFIGASNIHGAKKATIVGQIASLIVPFFNCVILYVFRFDIARLFTSDDSVITLVANLLGPLVSIVQIFDGIASVASGILRAQGLQKLGGVINLLSYYAFALPFGIYLSRAYDLELYGLWIGIGCGMAFIGLSENIVIFFSDWENIALQASMFETTSLDPEDSISSESS
ncbi:Piso0_000888 [Millerozyma farinosa CBS 7064]|uniref:Piso0_000888 protein n=1 Tax=Pichia sorbitophila (strain ATCC MYA-4447 / BCRC 22081 / CBS 7064 / NBRC 10061 / NRRL Y-12695) TaxID=559304 RepID=G8YRT3_PICSO|nr:Piso0_000888 [Millerozyma farinosa CBS 7064]